MVSLELADSYRQEFETQKNAGGNDARNHSFSFPEDGKHSYERRDKIDIILNILEVTKQPVKKTHILYTAKINFYQLARYLDLVVNMGLVEEISQPFEGYRITEKGRVMLKLFFPK